MPSRRSSRTLNLSFHPRYHKPAGRGLRSFALVTALIFAWTLVLSVPVQALTHLPKPKRTGVRVLSQRDMQKIVGSQHPPGPSGKPPLNPAPGPTLPWNPPFPSDHPPTLDITVNNNTASSSSTSDGIMGPLPETINPATGNKFTEVPLFSWTARGGMPIGLNLYHSSQSTRNKELGSNWILSFDITASVNGTNGNVTITWGNELTELFVKNMDGSYSAPTGFHDTLVKNGDSTYTLTNKEELQYHFNTSLLCNTITDENGNQVSISWNTSNNVSSVTDPSSRSISIGYTSGRITTITDPLNRQFGLSYDSSGNLQTITYPQQQHLHQSFHLQ